MTNNTLLYTANFLSFHQFFHFYLNTVDCGIVPCTWKSCTLSTHSVFSRGWVFSQSSIPSLHGQRSSPGAGTYSLHTSQEAHSNIPIFISGGGVELTLKPSYSATGITLKDLKMTLKFTLILNSIAVLKRSIHFQLLIRFVERPPESGKAAKRQYRKKLKLWKKGRAARGAH